MNSGFICNFASQLRTLLAVTPAPLSDLNADLFEIKQPNQLIWFVLLGAVLVHRGAIALEKVGFVLLVDNSLSTTSISWI